MERLTKVVVVGWLCGALALQAWLLASWPALPLITLGAGVTALAVGCFDRRSVALVLAIAYVFPAVIGVLHGVPFGPYNVVWMAALFGAMLPDSVRTSWRIPAPWRGALVFAALATCVGATIVICREIDGTIALLTSLGEMSWAGGNSPRFSVMWTLNVALVLLIGILWFDWLFETDVDFERGIVTPLALSAFVLGIAATYQLFADMQFINPTAFAVRGRTTGTMYDANVAGILSAFWIGGMFLWADRLRGWRVYAAPVGMLAGWLAVWGSGSKTALISAALITLAIALTMVQESSARRARRVVLAIGLAATIVTIVSILGITSSRTSNPASRVWRDLVVSGIVTERGSDLWNRDGFGAAASTLIRRYPITGVGVGRFYEFATTFPRADGRGRLPPDNAQNWLRHQIAEFGFVGGLGWIAWCVAFAGFVFVPRPRELRGAWTARSMLIAFGFISLFGMPGQDLMVTITFWTMAFWYVRLSGAAFSARPPRPWIWIAGGLALCVFAIVSIMTAASDLRLPARARRASAPFSYGFAAPDSPRAMDGYRVTQGRAAALVDTTGPWMAVSVRLDASHTRPVDVRIWKDGAIILKAMLETSAPITAFVRVADTPGRVLLEASARTRDDWWPSLAARDIGLRVKWTFMDVAPPDVRGYPAATIR